MPTGSPTQNTVAVMLVCSGYFAVEAGGVAVAVAVAVGVGVPVGVAVGIAVGVRVGVAVATTVAAGVGVFVAVAVGVGVGVRAGVAVGQPERERQMPAGATVGALVGTAVAVWVGVTVGFVIAAPQIVNVAAADSRPVLTATVYVPGAAAGATTDAAKEPARPTGTAGMFVVLPAHATCAIMDGEKLLPWIVTAVPAVPAEVESDTAGVTSARAA
ncbi:MAG: hypothetical protein HYX51_01795 [Chloroflexi bacterium]|nr:hypothetical protein [Chloroflexota bacterium]